MNLHAGATWKSKDEPDHDSLASAPFAVDHDGDGDLDLIVGNIAGRVILIPNEGTPKQPSFNPKKRRALEAGGKPIQVERDSGPVAADWDQDGKLDLLVGSGDGAVWFHRNIGTAAEPRYEQGAALLGKADVDYEKAVPAGTAPKGPGLRTKVHITDWNGDGRADLLVGDFWYEKGREPKLSAEDVKKRDDLRKRQEETSRKWSELQAKLGKENRKDPELKKLQDEMLAIYTEQEPLESRSETRGSVWLYLREAKAAERK